MTKYVSFDLETTGLNAPECEVISYCLGDMPNAMYSQTLQFNERELLLNLDSNISEMSTGILTFNGGTKYNSGFDFSFLRTRCALQGVRWPFAGIPHIDIYPIIQKRFNTSTSYWPKLDQLLVDDLKTMMNVFGIEGKPKKKQDYIDTITELSEPHQISEYISDNFEPKRKDINNLKGAYELLTGDASGDMRGEDVPLLWDEYKNTGDATILESIKEYNRADCEKVEILWDLIQQCVPSRDLIPEVL